MERAPAAFFIHILAQNMHLILASNIKAGREVRMLKKLVWLMFLVLVTACSVVMGDLSDLIVNPTPVASETPALTEEIPTELPLPTEAVTPEATLLPTIEETLAPTVEPTEAETLAPSLEPTLTSTPTATLEPTPVPPTATPTPLPATATPTATALPFIYAIQADTPLFMQNFVHPTEACNWQGIAGQVFNSAKTPVANLVVKVTGTWQNKPFIGIGVTGMVDGKPYGPGSYEIVLGTTPLSSVDKLTIQVFDERGNPLSAAVPFSTSADCAKNLIVINFVQK